MEVWDVYDLRRNKTNRVMVRGEKAAEGDYHLVVHVCIFNKEGNMLIQHRHENKRRWPDKWDLTVGGGAIQGETSQDAAKRELQEELGIELDLEDVRPHLTVSFKNGFDDIYLVEKDIDIKDLKLQNDEVKDVKWASREAILKMIEDEEFIPYYPSFIHM
ncbi:MAG: NUDIX domain-containing protein, partial [Clostridiales bacterium]|nr:NUDIX domain-containing protein [Clostridiales bacterium]